MQSRFLLFAAVLLCHSSSYAAEPAVPFAVKAGDVWVMAGDSITAQHLHSNYYEAFCFARYPKLNFRFRNSGVNLARFTGNHTAER